MSEFRKYMINNVNNDFVWSMLDENFDKYYIQNKSTIANIPKIIHQVWLGGSFPDKYKRMRDTWIEKNPDWEYKLWTDDDVDGFQLKNIDNFNKIDNLGSKSDIFRYEILYKYGGLYIDTDFECLKSFNDFIYLDLFTGTGHISIPEVFNGLIACKPGHNLIRNLIDGISIVSTNNFDKILEITGPRYFSSKLFEYIQNNKDEKIVVFPTTFFYPFPAEYRFNVRNDNIQTQEIISKYYTDKSYCVHLWYTSWQK